MPEIRKRDESFLMFLFVCQDFSLAAEYDRRDRRYVSWLIKKFWIYVLLYPVMVIWLLWKVVTDKEWRNFKWKE